MDYKLKQYLNPSYLPIRESEVTASLFRVGLGLEFDATHTGELVCFANDADHLYWNNQDQLRVVVTRVSWPPAKHSDLEAQLPRSMRNIYTAGTA